MTTTTVAGKDHHGMRGEHVLLMSALFAGACAERVPLHQPIGESLVMSSPLTSPPEAAAGRDEEAAKLAASDPELYVTNKSSGPCGMDQLPTIVFASTSIEPADPQVTELRHLAGCLTEAPYDTASIVLVGYTDVVGTVPANLALGLQRAQSVMTHLIDGGVSPGRIVVASAGELQRPSSRWGFRAHRVEVFAARGGPPRANEAPIVRGIDAEGLLPRPRPASSTPSPKPTTPPPSRPAAPRSTAPPSNARSR